MQENIRSKVAVIIPSYKAKNKLGWEPKISLKEMIVEMVESDLKVIERENINKNNL